MRASTLIVMGATVLSRLTGLVREIVIAGMFGVGATMSAFTVAFQIPNLIRTTIADAALTSSLIPAFTELVEQQREAHAWRVASTIVSLILIVLIPLTLVSMWAAPQIIALVVHEGFGQMPLAVELFRIMIPLVVLTSLSGVVIGILNAYGHFSAPALAPVAWNLVVVAMVLVGVQHVDRAHQIHVYAVAAIAGTAVQLFLLLPWLRGHGYHLGVAFAFSDPHVKAIGAMVLPVVLSLLLLDVNTLVNTYFSTRIPVELVPKDTGPAVLDKAFRVLQLPQGIFSVAVSSVFFPLFARHSARDDTEGFRAACVDGLRQIFVLLLPAAALMVVLAEPVVRVLYERGAWDPLQTPLVARTLRGLSVGLVANGAILLLMRAFFSLRRPWVPAIIGLINFGANALIAGMLHARYGTWGIALSTSLANTIAVVAMYIVLRRHLGGLPDRQVLDALCGALAASAVAALIGGTLAWATVDLLGTGALAELLAIAIGAGGTYALYLTMVVRLKLMSTPTLRGLARHDNKGSGPM